MQITTNKNIYFFLIGEPDKDLTSLLRISIKDRESGLRSYLVIRLLVGLIYIFLVTFESLCLKIG